MTIAPTGNLSVPLHQLRNLLLASANWQAWCGGATPAAANAYLMAAPGKLLAPHSIIDYAGNLVRVRDGVTIDRFLQAGDLLLYFGAPVTAGFSENDAATDHLNHVDAILADLETAPNDAGAGLVIQQLSLVAGPSRMPLQERDKNGDIYESTWLVETTVRT